MWPWEHAIIGYLVYSMFVHLRYRESPTAWETLIVVFASVLPDLIDKPLAWEFGVFQSGYALGHSIFFAIPLAILAGLAARRYGCPKCAIAFAIGYLLHLPADIVDGYFRGGHFEYRIVLWPVWVAPGGGQVQSWADQVGILFGRYLDSLQHLDASMYLQFQLGIAVFTFVLWMYDGTPVLRELGGFLARAPAKLIVTMVDQPGRPRRK